MSKKEKKYDTPYKIDKLKICCYNVIRGDDAIMIKRKKYLEDIRPFYDEDLIKVITGIRRCGKSTLLEQIVEELSVNVDKEHIIYINFEDVNYSDIKDFKDLNNYIVNLIKDDKKYYLLFDEIQNIEKWEKTVNSLKATKNVSLFITGSNSDLLSGDLATYLSGRYVSFKMQPFTFEEVCELKGTEDYENIFLDYIKWGGMPQRFRFNGEKQLRTYLSDVYDSIVMKDIIKRFKITDLDLFNRIVEYIMTTPAQSFSAENLVNYLKDKDDRNVSKETIYNYLEYMCKGLLVSKVDRYDVRGKRILNGKYKYYLADLGLGRIMNTSKKEQLGAYVENVVYNELIYRGYDVKIGTLENGEIDFIALKDGNKEYYQVCYELGDNEPVINREFGAFDNVHDHYPKYVISTDKFDMSQDGVIHKNIIDWLLEK